MTERLAPRPGEWIDRGRKLEFRFEGRSFSGFEGDTITSALAAAGVKLLGRSFKYHRPRGVHSFANHDTNVMVEDGGNTNIRADVTPLWQGADLRAVNTTGGVESDRMGIVDWFSSFLPVGFYYKAFHSKWLFPFAERQMRKVAGLGRVLPEWERERFPAVHDFCDVLVIGAGPAGLSAALAASRPGLKVVVVDEQQRPGGSTTYQGVGSPAVEALRAQWDAAGLAQLDVRCSTTAIGCYADGWVGLVDSKRLTKMRAKSIVVATGAMEQPAVFANNDHPGVMLATAAQRLIHRFAVKPFKRAVVLAANDFGYRAALEFKAAGVDVAAVVELRASGDPALTDELQKAGVPIKTGRAVTIAHLGSGKSLGAVQVCPIDDAGKPNLRQAESIDCDGLAMSVGFAPADGLFYQAGGRMIWDEGLQQFIPRGSPPGVFVAGRVNGVYGCEDEAADGRRAGQAAAAFLKAGEPPTDEPKRPAISPNHPYPIVPNDSVKCFVDMDEDVHYKDFVNAAQEGFDHVELLKRYSTFGMGASQGKHANLNAIRILAKTKGQTVGETGVTTARPFTHPVPLGILAGRGFHVHRRSPLESRHAALAAHFMLAGDWRRPAFYPRKGAPNHVAIAQEVTAVRTAVGMIDVGTLGKIEVSGQDAGEFIDRIYTGRFSNMKVGTARYGLMCDETGVIIDDGLVARLADDRFYVTTTTSAAGGVYREMQRWAIVWGLSVTLASATGARGAVNVAGPKARELLAKLSDVDLSPAAFPYMHVREGTIAGVPARFLRVGFVGEWGCEIHVPSYGMPVVWDAIMKAGEPLHIRPFGVEAQRILRLEKAHVIVSQDTDGLTNPFEANMAWAVKDDKPFFVGQRSLRILRARPLKRKLVGFTLPKETEPQRVPKECNLIVEGREIKGRVTSIARSPTLEQAIGLAFVTPEMAEPATQFTIRLDNGSTVTATVVETPFYDPKAARQSGADPS